MGQYENAPPPSATAYRTPEPNAAIPLYSGRLRLRQGGNVVDGDGSVELRWLPTPTLHFVMPRGNDHRLALDECDVELVDRGWSNRGVLVRAGSGGLRGMLDQCPGMSGWMSGPSAIVQVRVHVPNFHKTPGSPLARADSNGSYRGRSTFEIGPWRLTCDQLAPDIHDALKAAGGDVFTHVLVCERIDGATFEPAAMDELVRSLDLALSFCLGSWTGCALATGYDEDGRLVWEQWRMPWLTSYSSSEFSWFPPMPVGALGNFVPGFVRALESPSARRALGNCVHWYVEANAGHGGLEGAITMALMGLELLSWLELVDRNAGDPDAFKAAPAHRKIREYLVAKSIPLDVQALPRFATFTAAEQNCVDGLEAATRLRNRAVHPPRTKFADYPIELREEAWRYTV